MGERAQVKVSAESKRGPVTVYATQTFKDDGKKLALAKRREFATPEGAVAFAEQIAPSVTGVIAFAQTSDASADLFEEPVLLHHAGRVPRELVEGA